MSDTTKITVDVPAELHERLTRLIPWGLRKHLVTSVLNTVLGAIETDGEIVMGAIMAQQYKLQWTGDPAGTVQNSDSCRGKK